MRTKIPGKMDTSDYGIRIKLKHEMKILRKSISDLYRKKRDSERNISRLKLDLREKHKLSGRFIENTINWLKKKVIYKTKLVKIKLRRKFQWLWDEKAKLEDERKRKKEEIEKQNIKNLDPRCEKKVVYNNSSRKLTEKEIELLSLGLNFGLTPKKFPLVEYITATEVLCKSLEDTGVDEDIENAQKIRNLLLSHIREGFKMKIKSNLSKEEREILKGLKDDVWIIICPADKGKAVVVEDRDAYKEKMQQQIDEGDYKPAKGKEKTLLNKIHGKLVAQLKKWG